jgi:antitoxin ParD1/3/4
MNVSLTPELDRYVHSKVEEGNYNSASEVLRLMQERDELRQMHLNEIRQRIQIGLDELASGNFVEGTSDELYESAIKRSRERLKARAESVDTR